MVIGSFFLEKSRLNLMDSSIAYDDSQLVFVIPRSVRLNFYQKVALVINESRFYWMLFVLIIFLVFGVIFILNHQSVATRTFVFGRNTRILYLNIVSTILGIPDKVVSKAIFSRIPWMFFVLFCFEAR